MGYLGSVADSLEPIIAAGREGELMLEALREQQQFDKDYGPGPDEAWDSAAFRGGYFVAKSWREFDWLERDESPVAITTSQFRSDHQEQRRRLLDWAQKHGADARPIRERRR